ncbi:MAG TPA: DUF1592 domain-containing protein [Nannocystaceae bacterium]|nr:DUF1592 domain-containing protein [Nannocystaceae bacterium]
MGRRLHSTGIAIWALTLGGCYRGLDVAPNGSGEAGSISGGESLSGGSESGGSESGGDVPDAELEPAPPTIHRLTQPQLQNSWLALLGEPLVLPTDLPTDDLLYGFTSIAAAGATISGLAAEQYENATYAVLDQVWADPVRRAELVGCEPTDASDPCISAFFERFAKAAWRRPVATAEVDALVQLTATIANDFGDVNKALEYGAASVLQSPNFLFRVELGVEDPNAPGILRFTSWEMASRLSYLIIASPPDAQLVAAAEADELQSVDAIESEALRLLEDPRARPALVGFFRDFMNIAKLDALDKSVEQFPQMSATMGVSMRLELEKLFEATTFDASGDFRELFTTPDSFINEDLAKVYGIPGIVGPDLRPYTFGDDAHRAGLLTSAGFLAVNAHKTQTSPTHRGRFVRIQLLCQDVPPPPEGVDTSLPAPDPNAPPKSLRERLEIHREQAACKGCHELMDPIGFAFEGYDAIGAYREIDELGLPIDSTSDIEGTPVTTGTDVGSVIAQLPQASQCIARRFYEHAGGHLVEEGEEDTVQVLVQDFIANDYDFRSLVVALVVNDGFRFASAEASP